MVYDFYYIQAAGSLSVDDNVFATGKDIIQIVFENIFVLTNLEIFYSTFKDFDTKLESSENVWWVESLTVTRDLKVGLGPFVLPQNMLNDLGNAMRVFTRISYG